MKTIGIFGGSFDPIHKGHTALAEYIVKGGLCDEVILLVSPLNPLKTDRPPVSLENRMEMARLATENIAGVTPSDLESRLTAPFYTYRTLKALSKAYPDVKFRLIIGADNWVSFNKWKNPDEIVTEYSPIVYPRPGIALNLSDIPREVTYLTDAPQTAISSTEIRRLIGIPEASCPENLDLRVWSYARSHGLYNPSDNHGA